MSETQTYNGWKNYETWAVKLWLDNDYGSYQYMQEMVESAKTYADDHPNVNAGIWTEQEAVRFSLADQLKQEIEENTPEIEGMYSDLLNAALSEVDWQEIADEYLDD